MKLNIFLLIILCSCLIASANGADPEGVLPKECRAGYLLRARKPAAGDASPAAHSILRPSPSGRPTLLVNGQIIALGIRPDDPPARFVLPEGWRDATDFCWLTNGMLGIISGKRFGVMNGARFERVLALPELGMRLAPAARGGCYLYGGTGKQNNVYRYDVAGAVTNLVCAPAAVTAVAGDGLATLIGVGKVIYLFAQGHEPVVVLVASEEIQAVAFAPPSALFYATTNRVGYLSGPGKGFSFLKEGAQQLFCGGTELYVHTQGGDVLQIGPTSGFSSLCDRIQALRPSSMP